MQHEKITVEVARVAFQRMKDLGSRLPWREAEQMLQLISLSFVEITSSEEI